MMGSFKHIPLKIKGSKVNMPSILDKEISSTKSVPMFVGIFTRVFEATVTFHYTSWLTKDSHI